MDNITTPSTTAAISAHAFDYCLWLYIAESGEHWSLTVPVARRLARQLLQAAELAEVGRGGYPLED